MVDPVEALAAEPERTVAFEAVFNFRDLGGYPAGEGRSVRWRRLFRADGLQRLRPEEGRQFRSLGIATVVDLRTPQEADDSGRFPAEVAEVEYHHWPMFDVVPDWSEAGDVDSPGFLADRYVEMLEHGRETVAGTLNLLSRSTAYPLVFHCAAGKDRTGILAALVLGLLGVPDEVIVDDYALSHEAMARMGAWVRENMPEVAERASRQAYPASVAEAKPETMVRFLAHLRANHGTLGGLAADLGVGAEVIEAMQANLLVPEEAVDMS